MKISKMLTFRKRKKGKKKKEEVKSYVFLEKENEGEEEWWKWRKFEYIKEKKLITSFYIKGKFYIINLKENFIILQLS